MSSNATITPLWLKLRALLKKEGVVIDDLSVDKLAVALQCSRGTAQRIKEGHTNQRRDTIIHLAKRFDVSEAELLEAEEIPSYFGAPYRFRLTDAYRVRYAYSTTTGEANAAHH